MKAILILLSASMLACLIPPALAYNTAVTAADIEQVMAKNALINNDKDYAIYMDSDAQKLHGEYIDPEHTYKVYYVTEYGDMDYEVNYFIGKDAETASIKDGLGEDYEYPYQTRKNYSFRAETMPGVYDSGQLTCYSYLQDGGARYATHATRYTMSFGTSWLFFGTDTLAEVINDNGLGAVSDIRLFYGMGDSDNVTDYQMIYIETSDGEEYVLTDIKYRNGSLESCSLLDRKAFIYAMQGDYAPARELGYSRLKVNYAPQFSDISGDSAVSLLARLGILDGYDDGSFGGDGFITRAEAAKLLAYISMSATYNIASISGVQYDNALEDVTPEHWAFNYIEYGFLKGYINGKEQTGTRLANEKRIKAYMIEDEGVTALLEGDRYIDTYNFCPEDYVTEQELAKMLVCITERFITEMAAAEGGWPEGYVAIARRLGICDTASDAPATRLAAAHMIKNTLDAEVNEQIDFFDEWNPYTGRDHSEIIFERNVFFNNDIMSKRVRLTGRIAEELRGGEFRFIVDNDAVSARLGEFKKGNELTVLAGYDDVYDFIGRDCAIYCEQSCGNLKAIMAE